MTDLPTALSDADLVGAAALEVVTVDDLRPGLVRRILGLPGAIIMLPIRTVRWLLRRPKLLVLAVLAAVLAAAVCCGPLRSGSAADGSTADDG
ncbi:MAG: hypothetical protein OEU32_12940 [Acidimicrobiia bacterium]|nr:hypothetical protein [Acidimicrobiia bacterium]